MLVRPVDDRRESALDRPRLSTQIARSLVEKVVGGSYTADALLPTEFQVAQEYGVSRTVMREALKLVEAKGLISIEHGRGTRVLGRDKWNILDATVIEYMSGTNGVVHILEDLLETRWLIEVEAAALAAKRGGP